MGWVGAEFFQELLDHVQALDEVFIDHVNKRRAQELKDTSAKPAVVAKR